MRRVFVSDCEGPVSKNDIAFELAAHLIPEGDRVFDLIRMYDYVHANFPKRRDYSAGNASKLVLPFLLAYDASNKTVEEFSASNLILLNGSKETMSYVPTISEAFMVSTSYEQYVRALCRQVGFPLENTYSVEVNLDEFSLSAKEKAKLKGLAWEIGGMPPITIPQGATGIQSFSNRDRETVSRLDRIFWKEVAGTHCKRILSDVKMVGGVEKADAVREISDNLSTSMKDLMYVGDDWTDVEALRLVRACGGLTVAINGDGPAVKSSELAVMSETSAAIAVLADVFLRFGRAEVTSVAGAFDRDSLWRSAADPGTLDRLFEVKSESWPKVFFVSEWNMDAVANESVLYRKAVVGKRVAKSPKRD